MLPGKKQELVDALTAANAEGKIIDEIPLPFYSPRTDSCIFHFRSKGEFVSAYAIQCNRQDMLELHAFLLELLPSKS